MFTGLVEEVGEVTAVEDLDGLLRLTVAGPLVTTDATHGCSIAVAGVCLTVVELSTDTTGRGTFTADVMRQTLDLTTMGSLAPGDRVNLERAMPAGARLGGHIVQGHVDGTTEVITVRSFPGGRALRMALPGSLAALLVPQGSITVDGVSLTVSSVGEDWFEVSLIPETLASTTLGAAQPGTAVNLETDILLRHVQRIAQQPGSHSGCDIEGAYLWQDTEGPSAIGVSTIEQALTALRAGRPVLVADDEDRENEGDIILSAALATPEWISWTVAHSSGLLCAPMTQAIADRLELPMMVQHNEDVRGTAYTVTVDAASGVSTGISASDRARTLRVLADPDSTPGDLRRPGHVLPLRAVAGGVLARAGHTEAGVDLMRLAGLPEIAVIAEVVDADGGMMRLPALLELGARENIPVITIEQLIAHRRTTEETTPAAPESTHPHRRITRRAETTLPTTHGPFRALGYRDRRSGIEHLALVATGQGSAPPLVRVHSECLTGEALGSLKCECGPQLQAALARVQEEGGVVVYLRGQEGRGIGLANKLRAYQLQEQGLDTVDANLSLGRGVDEREYLAAAEILQDLGIERIRLLSNNPDKARQLTACGITITESIPLITGLAPENNNYVATKRDRMNHTYPKETL